MALVTIQRPLSGVNFDAPRTYARPPVSVNV
jgi:hypothetical protein